MPYSLPQIADFAASALLAWAAAFRGARHGLPPAGSVILGMLCGLVYPALRLLILSGTAFFRGGAELAPVLFFLAEPAYPAAAFCGAFAGFLLQRRIADDSILFPALEALSLGAAASLGVYFGFAAYLPPFGAVLFGCFSGVCGGLVRDICLAERPALLEAEFYGGAVAVGAMAAAAAYILDAGFWPALGSSCLIVVALRLLGRRRARRRGVFSEF